MKKACSQVPSLKAPETHELAMAQPKSWCYLKQETKFCYFNTKEILQHLGKNTNTNTLEAK